jgi:CrcB protein
VALSGAIGAVSRLGVTQMMSLWLGKNYPWGTLTVNILGSFAIGYLMGLWSSTAAEPSSTVRAAIIVGFLGAFTTMSAFSLDSWELLHRGDWFKALTYMGITVIGSLAAVSLGLFLNLKN